ncbi:RNA-binding S4 domain-containing protein [Terrihabitans sp. B22-R8]|uniref:RNA-binding S4 domain-containing protein n=1 Tax=Terrihabitans sp. B22-R8 TaxID=3425128 RepID=UPI00403C8D0B
MEGGRQRIDKWLWFARVVKTRTLAQELAKSGHVRVNGARVDSASQAVKAGDVLTIALEQSVRILKVQNFAERRGSATLAQALYEDLSPPPPQRADDAGPDPTGPLREDGAGRPTKRERRETDRLLGRD